MNRITKEALEEFGPDEYETACANWDKGCSGVTDGLDNDGNLTLCYDCQDELDG